MNPGHSKAGVFVGVAIIVLTALWLERESVEWLAGPLDQQVYVWQRNWGDAVRSSVATHGGEFSQIVYLGAEIEWISGRSKVVFVTPDYESLKRAGTSAGVAIRSTNPWRAENRVGITATLLVETAQTLIQDAADEGLKVSELQIDIDSPTSKLGRYSEWLSDVREGIPDIPLTVTALPAWLEARDCDRVFDKVDGFVLQVHSLEKPATIDSLYTLCDVNAALISVERAARYGKPFRVALPTYGYGLGFDENGEFVSLSAETGFDSFAAGTRVRQVHANPRDMTYLINTWTERRPVNMEGVIWYRLPVEGDRMNWSWTTLNEVMQGRAPLPDVKIHASELEPGLVEIEIANEGTADRPGPLSFNLSWNSGRLIAWDTLNGAEAKQVKPDELQITTLLSERLAVGQQRKVAWLRFENSSEVKIQEYENDN